eukprot:TRINITY_DN11453_c0_g1_i1.p1 TRINITY_DN11453_c0_g1~~TRINITY_DN11453_c0_g1_i1.p1  ORF type:complete len:300 (+),score=101.67 TRINITY_DN11453_c0_g1_i1:310-1209(+)
MSSALSQSLSKAETLAMAQKTYQQQQLEKHLAEDYRIFYIGEKRQRTFKLMASLYISVSVVFGIFSAALEIFTMVDEQNEPNAFDYEALAFIFLMVSLASFSTFLLLLAVYPSMRLLVLTQSRLLLVEKPSLGSCRVRSYNLKDLEDVSVCFDVRSGDFPHLSEQDPVDIANECRARPDEDGILTVRSSHHILKPYFHINIENSNSLIESLSTVLERTPDFSSTSQRRSISFGFAISLAVFIPFFTLVFIITFVSDPHLLILLTPFFLVFGVYVVYGSWAIFDAWNRLSLNFSFALLNF